jgi:hypothetical protein
LKNVNLHSLISFKQIELSTMNKFLLAAMSSAVVLTAHAQQALTPVNHYLPMGKKRSSLKTGTYGCAMWQPINKHSLQQMV